MGSLLTAISQRHIVEGGTISTADGKTTLNVLNAADWMTLEANGKGVIVNARVTAASEKGINLDLQYLGKLHFSPQLMEMFTGKRSGLEFGEGYYYVQPQIASRSPEFEWVNSHVFLGQGLIRLREDGKLEVAYRIYRVD